MSGIAWTIIGIMLTVVGIIITIIFGFKDKIKRIFYKPGIARIGKIDMEKWKRESEKFFHWLTRKNDKN